MTKLRGYIPTMLMLVTLMFGTSAANAGVLTGGRASNDAVTSTCGETTITGLLSVLASFARTGVLTGGRIGVLTGGRQETCSVESLGVLTGG